jgi:hypothetical protein
MPGRDKAKIIRALSAAYLSNDRTAIEDSFTRISVSPAHTTTRSISRPISRS